MNEMGSSRSTPHAPPVPYATLLAALGEGVVVQAEGGEILYANPRALAQLGLTGSDLPALVELGWIGSEAPDSGEPGLPVHEVFDNGAPIDARVVGLRTPHGGRRWFALSAMPLWLDGWPPRAAEAGEGDGRGSDARRYELAIDHDRILQGTRHRDGPPSAAVVTIRDVTAVWRDRQRLARQARFRSGLVRLLDGALGSGAAGSFDRSLLEVAVEILPDAQAGVLLRREDGDLYAPLAAVGFDVELLAGVRFRGADQAALDAGRVSVSRFAQEPALRPLEPALAARTAPGTPAHARLTVPITAAGRAQAILVLDNLERPNAFDGEAVEAAQILAASLATLWQRHHLDLGPQQERAHLDHLGLHDPLTGLPNRVLALDRLGHAMAAALRDGRRVALMLLELDGFERLAAELGGDHADRLLAQVAGRLRGGLREVDTVACWRTATFAILATGLHDEQDALQVARKTLALFDAPFRAAGAPRRLRAALGVDLYPHQATSAEELVQGAELALYRTHVDGEHDLRFAAPDLDEERTDQEALERELRRALAGDGVGLLYQPRVDLATLRVTGLEALVRWRRGRGPEVPVAELLRVAERVGLAHELGESVLRSACAQAAGWRHARIDVPVSINLAPSQVLDGGLVGRVGDALRAYRLPAGALEVEVSEAAALRDPAASQRLFDGLRELGVAVSLDDVGNSASSLLALARLAPRRLKIDPSLVAQLDAGDEAGGPVRAAIALARSLACTVVAEGVETPAQRRALRALQCDEAQGFLFARPLEPAELEPLLDLGRIDPGAPS